MINRKDLMINDLLQTEDGRIGKYNGEFRRCITCDFDFYRICLMSIRSDTDGLHLPEARVNPIPLTEEILLKTGFRITGSFIELVEYALNDVDTEICVFYNRESKSPYFYAEIANVAVEIKYFHQLQHLLRLCGMREIADNLKIK